MTVDRFFFTRRVDGLADRAAGCSRLLRHSATVPAHALCVQLAMMLEDVELALAEARQIVVEQQERRDVPRHR